jgi:hypothetical protein
MQKPFHQRFGQQEAESLLCLMSTTLWSVIIAMTPRIHDIGGLHHLS